MVVYWTGPHMYESKDSIAGAQITYLAQLNYNTLLCICIVRS